MTSDHFLRLSDDIDYPYSIVVSKRAKYLRIKLSTHGLLSVTVPYLIDVNIAHDFINSKKAWVEKSLSKIKVSEVNQLPKVLNLRLIGEVWNVSYEESTIETKLVITELEIATFQKEGLIRIKGGNAEINDLSQVSKLLNKWCRNKAFDLFSKMLNGLAENHGFHYNNLAIRSQKTRWGSCSSKKNINLNSKLIFLPKEIVEYVMIHELCHTIEMNHSSAFWALVDECDPNYNDNKRQLRIMGQKIPI